MNKPYRVVVFGGGSGCFSLLRGLKKFSGLIDITSIFTIADDGGSSGVLRSEFGILPPGDLRRHIAALSDSSEIMLNLLNFRFKEGGGVKDHSLGNLIYTALTKIMGGDEGAIKEMNNLFKTNESRVLPASLDKVKLIAEYANGDILRGESQIDLLKNNSKGAVRRVYLEPEAVAYSSTVDAIKEATHIVLSAGDLYTSLIPILLVKGIVGAIEESKAKVVYISNLMTKPGETDNFKVEDFIRIINSYLSPKSIDCVLVNSKVPSIYLIRKYKEEGSHIVKYDLDKLGAYNLRVIEGDFVNESDILRHDSNNTALALVRYLLEL